LNEAASKGYLEIVQCLMDRAIDANTKDNVMIMNTADII
jgi:hypothetical protein